MMKKLLTLIAIVAITLSGIVEAKSYRESADAYIRDRVVMLTGNKMQCSGIQVKSPKFGYVYILTAAHCAALLDNDKKMTAQNEQGEKKTVQLIKVDDNSDLMLLTPMDSKFIKIADSAKRHQRIRTLTHGAGHATYTTWGELMEDQKLTAMIFPIFLPSDRANCPKDKIHAIELVPGFLGDMEACVLKVTETMSDAMTVGGSSGGAVVDNYGHLVGIESTGIDSFSGFVRFSDIQAFMSNY